MFHGTQALAQRLADWLDRRMLPLVLLAAALGLSVPAPSRAAVTGHGISLALAALVAAVGMGIAPSALLAVAAVAPRILLALVLGAATLPALGFLASRLVTDGPLRQGVLAAGVAPSEVAAVALTALAGGEAAIAAGVLVGSTLICVVSAGPVLGLLAGAGTVSAGGLITSLARIVALPLVVGMAVRAVAGRRYADVIEAVGAVVAAGTVLILVWLVAGQAHLSLALLRAGVGLLVFLAGSALVGVLASVRMPRRHAVAILLPTTMRDFAIAAGVATAAFGPKAAAPLGLYGVLVLVFGAVVARVAARTTPRT